MNLYDVIMKQCMAVMIEHQDEEGILFTNPEQQMDQTYENT